MSPVGPKLKSRHVHFESAKGVRAGEFIGAIRHVSAEDHDILRVEFISDEAFKTFVTEGKILNHEKCSVIRCSES